MRGLQGSISGLSEVINSFSLWCGRMVSWLTLLMALLVFVVVLLRYVFNTGSIQLQESITYLHGMVFLIGAAYTLQQDAHVRVDVFYRQMSHRHRAWVDLVGTLVFLLPVCLYIFWVSLDYVVLSWKINESSGEAGGLPALYLLKSLLLVMPLLLIMQGLSGFLRCLLFLFADGESPYQSAPEKASVQEVFSRD